MESSEVRIRPVVIDDETVALKLLVDRRQELVAARTASMCRLHRLLRELIPGGAPRELSADRAHQLLDKLDVSGPAAVMRRDLGFEHIEDVPTGGWSSVPTVLPTSSRSSCSSRPRATS